MVLTEEVSGIQHIVKIPGTVHIQHQDFIRSYGAAHKLNSGLILLRGKIEFPVFHEAESHFIIIAGSSNFHFESSEASVQIAFNFLLKHIQGFSFCIEACAGVCLNPVTYLPQQLADRKAGNFAKEIP